MTKKTKPEGEILRAMQDEVTDWARQISDDPNTVYIDLETTGLPAGDHIPGVVQLSMVNYKGRPLFSMLLQPLSEGGIPLEASACHGIYDEDVKTSPYITDLEQVIFDLTYQKNIVTYNADFDWGILTKTWKEYNLDPLRPRSVHCAMEKYAIWNGEWNNNRGDFRWKKLPNLTGGMAHDALQDCESLRLLVEKMKNPPYEKVQVREDDLVSLDF